MINRRHFIATAAASTLGASAYAQVNPKSPVTLLVPFAPGGTTDIIARLIAPPLSQALAQEIRIENIAGGGGIKGAAELARSPADGYTLGMATVSTTATNPAINPSLPYNTLTDFTPIMNIAATPNVIAVHPRFPARDYASFVAELKKNPGVHTYASSGTGGIGHMQMEMFKSLTGTRLDHVPYAGAGPALADCAAGKVPIILDNLPSALPYIRSGRLIPIAVASDKRVIGMRDVPTFHEVRLELMNQMAYYGLIGPKGLAPAVTRRIHGAMSQSLAAPLLREQIEKTGSVIVGNTPEFFAAQIKAEYSLYKAMVSVQKLKFS